MGVAGRQPSPFAVLLGLCLSATSLAGGPAALLDRVVAEVNDEVVLLSELGGAAGERDAAGRELLERMIDARLLRQEAERQGAEPPQEIIAEAVDERIEEMMASWPDQETFDAWLAAQEMTRASLRQRLREEETEAWMRRSAVMGRIGAPPASPEFEPQFELAQIVLALRPGASEATVLARYQECLDLRARVLEGEDFAELAVLRSDDPATGPAGGDLGILSVGVLDLGIAEGLRGLSDGDLTVPVRTERGWHLIQVKRLITARQRWYMQAFEDARASLLEELRRRGHITIHLDERSPP
jgi:parvulin-like peptidyl-prolyl isomerase